MPGRDEGAAGVERAIRELARSYAGELGRRVEARVREMEDDDRSHVLVYRILGVGDEEGRRIDLYQNKGRFLYKYAGAFMEEATRLCFRQRFPGAEPIHVPNPHGTRPRRFQVDCLIGNEAVEVKWRDATTDGDHVVKEHARIAAIAEAGYVPVRVMYFHPNREQAVRIQQALETLYAGKGGRYHGGEAAWAYVRERTGIDLRGILERLAREEERGDAGGPAPR